MTADEKYWFAEQRSQQAICNNMSSYGMMRKYFTGLLPHFGAAKFEVINCTPGSELKVFAQLSLEPALAEATSDIDTEAFTDGMYVDRFKSGATSKAAPARANPQRERRTGKAPELPPCRQR